MTPVDNRKQIAMMKRKEFGYVLSDAVKYLHEVVMSEPPASVEEYTDITKEVLQVLSSRYSEVIPKKVVKVRQVDLEESIAEIKQERYDKETDNDNRG